MKYFLAVDKGPLYKNNERYIKIDLGSYNKQLNKDNNLEALCIFTTEFNTKRELKDALVSMNLLEKQYYNYDLVITYKLGSNYSIEVPYACDDEFINGNNIKHLEEVIKEKAKNYDFLEILIHRYKEYGIVSKEIEIFRSYLTKPFVDYDFYTNISNFITKLCYKKVENKSFIKYRPLYDLGMLVSKLTNPGRYVIISSVAKEISPLINSDKETNISEEAKVFKTHYSEDDPKYFELEQLLKNEMKSREEIDENQMRLF